MEDRKGLSSVYTIVKRWGSISNIKVFPLVIATTMANFYVLRILIDERSSCDVVYVKLFNKLEIKRETLLPYKGLVQAFNGTVTCLWVYIEIRVTFEEMRYTRSINLHFPMVPCKSLYDFIFDKPFIVKLDIMDSPVRLNIK